MLSKFYESLYLKVFVNIVIGNSQTTVYVEMLNSNNKVVVSEEENFKVIYLDTNMYEFISSAIKESPYHYISILDNSQSQGAIPTCNKNKISFYHDVSSSEYKCHKDKWTFYTEKSDIYSIEKEFGKIGVDFIFSPFSVLANFFKDKIDTHLAMFVLIEDKYITLSIFNSSELLYAEHLDINTEIEHEELIMEVHEIDEVDLEEEDDDSINLDDIDALDDVDELDDFGDIADLDSIEEIDEFSEAKDIEEELFEDEEDEQEESESFNKDFQRFSLIQNSLDNFYKSDKYESEFIENIYIADYVDVSPDLKKYLEEEMFLNVYIRHIDICAEICELAKMELK